MQPKKKKEQLGLTALYCRLSRDDGAEGDSNSVANKSVYCRNTPKKTASVIHVSMWTTVIPARISTVRLSRK